MKKSIVSLAVAALLAAPVVALAKDGVTEGTWSNGEPATQPAPTTAAVVTSSGYVGETTTTPATTEEVTEIVTSVLPDGSIGSFIKKTGVFVEKASASEATTTEATTTEATTTKAADKKADKKSDAKASTSKSGTKTLPKTSAAK